MKRRAFQIVVLLLLLGGGTIVNVAVAWGACSRSSSRVQEQPALETAWIQRHNLTLPKQCYEWTFFGFGLKRTNFTTPDFLRWRYAGSTVQAGWPIYSLEGGRWREGNQARLISALDTRQWEMTKKAWPDGFIPVMPLWPGFAINTIFYAAMLWVVFFVPGMVRRRIRRRRGCCPACAYPIGTSPVCTECGAAVKQKAETQKAEIG